MIGDRFLLISHPMNSEWVRVLTRVLSPYGSLTVIGRAEIQARVNDCQYQMILVDAGIKEADEDSSMLLNLIAQLHILSPKSDVIIMTPTTTWRQAKECIQAGAADYLRQSMDEKKQLHEFEQSVSFLRLGKNFE